MPLISAASTQSVQTSLSVSGESSATFTAQKQSIFRIGTARALGVPVLSVALLSLDGVPLQASFRRRLLDAASGPQSVRSAVASGAVDAQLRAGGLAVQAALAADVAVVTLAPGDVIHDRRSAVPPAIGSLADVTVDQGQPMPKQSFTVTTSGKLGVSVSASASNSTLVPSSNVLVTFDGTAYGVQANPAPGQSGTTYILVTATDTAGSSNSEAFMLAVRPAQAGSTSGAGIVIYAAAAGGGGLLLLVAVAAGFFVHHRRKRNKVNQVVSVAPLPGAAVDRDAVQPFDAPAALDGSKAPVPAPNVATPSAPLTSAADSDPVASPRGQADLGLPIRSD
ncbi:hypothetical protein KFL_006800040 [Klebsormidium nitens]|uniref:Dystroglycan-type cadherin-like domain-containing protein n=1 Tax=Klebsormidium nitens TaxID=105231 RepID=A0A1Y1IRJ9_KLENI|nr:hypothetical protein KFL_006800040 [Klebsormidium nitens]|eukprot:GAQ90748.1 hypothetical protein KFL_006800040 [Klebsormidium nitens]